MICQNQTGVRKTGTVFAIDLSTGGGETLAESTCELRRLPIYPPFPPHLTMLS